MYTGHNSTDGRRRRWWVGFGTGLFLLVPLDLLTTLLSVAEYGVGVEANPLMRLLLGHGLLAVTAANLLVVGLAVYSFHVAVDAIGSAPAPHRHLLERGVDAWLGVVILGGVVLVGNNVLALA